MQPFLFLSLSLLNITPSVLFLTPQLWEESIISILMFSFNICRTKQWQDDTERGRKDTSELKSQNSHQPFRKREKQKIPILNLNPLFSSPQTVFFFICSCIKVYLGFKTNFSFFLRTNQILNVCKNMVAEKKKKR